MAMVRVGCDMVRNPRLGLLLVLVGSSYGCSGLLHAAGRQVAQDHADGAPPHEQVASPGGGDRSDDREATTSTYEYGPASTWKLYTILGPYTVQRSIYSPPAPATWGCQTSLGGGAVFLRIHNAYPSRSLMASGSLRFGMAAGATPVSPLLTPSRDAAAARGRSVEFRSLDRDTPCASFIFLEADWTGGKSPPTSFR